MTRTIAIVGATGKQGGGLARAILAKPESGFRARALTRNADSPAARALAKLGAEVVTADLDDAASVVRGFRGASAAFCVTNFWEHASPVRETTQARTMALAASESGVEHVVWSTLEDTRLSIPLSDPRMPTIGGRYKVPHFDAKADADAAFLEGRAAVTRYYASFYWDSFVSFGVGPKQALNGDLELRLPLGDEPLPGIASEDIGATALGVFERGPELYGASVGVAGAKLTGAEMAAAFARALGRPVRYVAVDPAEYRESQMPGAVELGNMFQFYRDASDAVCKKRDLAIARELNPELLDFDAWLKRWAPRIPLT